MAPPKTGRHPKTYTCSECGAIRVTRRKNPPKMCRVCSLRLHRRATPLSCPICGRVLNPKSSLKTKSCRECLVRGATTKFKEPEVDAGFGHWLSGFVDGEGNFQFYRASAYSHGFVFRIILREDDKAILEEIREYLGVGHLYYRDIVKNMDNWKPEHRSNVRNNQWVYIVQPIVDLIQVVIPHFDRYPLRAKKRKQYEAWKEALINTKMGALLYQEVVAGGKEDSGGCCPPLTMKSLDAAEP